MNTSRFWAPTIGVIVLTCAYIWVFMSKVGSNRTGNYGSSSFEEALERTGLAPGELPGYTGWPRPEFTLAGYFEGSSQVKRSVVIGEELRFSLECRNHPQCSKANSKFFVRAYGPAIIVGTATRRSKGVYDFTIMFPEAGLYTLEVILTFSDAQPIDQFPLADNRGEPVAYEGYLLPNFPLTIHVTSVIYFMAPRRQACTSSALVEKDFDSGRTNGYWEVMDLNRLRNHVVTANEDSLQKYKSSHNSVGFYTEYQRGCTLPNLRISCLNQKTTHFILIGDSVMRLQRDILQDLVQEHGNIRVSFFELFGGYWKTQLQTGPDIRRGIQEIQSQYPNDRYVIIFNTGMHDIHRLCGNEWLNDRREYLDDPSTSCTKRYEQAILRFADEVIQAKADIRLFQTTTGPWPKYGNFGIAWSPVGFQRLPLDASFAEAFNRIAFKVINDKYSDSIRVIDGYWISYSRPDNRETSKRADIGKKLSHPGEEVILMMVQLWLMYTILELC